MRTASSFSPEVDNGPRLRRKKMIRDVICDTIYCTKREFITESAWWVIKDEDENTVVDQSNLSSWFVIML